MSSFEVIERMLNCENCIFRRVEKDVKNCRALTC